MQITITSADLDAALSTGFNKDLIYNCPVAQCLNRVTGKKLGVSHSVACSPDETYLHDAAEIVNLYDAAMIGGVTCYIDRLRECLPFTFTLTPRGEVPQLCEVIQLASIDEESPQPVQA